MNKTMKEVILKATDGTEVVLTIEDEGSRSYPYIRKIQYIPENPIFKVGNWVYDRSISSIFRIIKVEDIWLHSDIKYGHFTNQIYCRFATPKEVEIHLLRVCEEKGLLKEGCHYQSTEGSFFQFNVGDRVYYDPSVDALYCKGHALYYKGEFAKILPERKKPLPKTKEDAINLLYAWGDYNNQPIKSVDARNFLKDYEDSVKL
jgi:hypothetical protein